MRIQSDQTPTKIGKTKVQQNPTNFCSIPGLWLTSPVCYNFVASSAVLTLPIY